LADAINEMKKIIPHQQYSSQIKSEHHIRKVWRY